MWTELLDMTDDELDALCAKAQDDADALPDGPGRELCDNLAEAAALILEDRGVILPVYACFDQEMLLAAYMHGAVPETEGVWSP